MLAQENGNKRLNLQYNLFQLQVKLKTTMSKSSVRTYQLASLADLELLNVKAELFTYRGRRAVRLVEDYKDPDSGEHAIAIFSGSDFKDGVIETEIAGAPLPDAPKDMRGFVGIAFRVHSKGARFECFYLRPTNGRADDQLRRNHATQYISHPDHPWFKLREENPGVYESYTDLIPAEWTKVKIIVSDTKAQLYVNGAKQPCLIVNDLKLGEARGGIALWIGGGTEAYFSEVIVKNTNE